VTVKTTGSDRTFIDYINVVHRFGIRVIEDRCSVVIHVGDGQSIFGKTCHIPLQLDTAPSLVRMIVDNDLMNYPNSDLTNVLTGKKSFQQALDSSSRN
jgi:hypothetical protein